MDQRFRRAVPEVGSRHAATRGHAQLLIPGLHHALGQRLAQTFGHAEGGGAVGVGQDHRELLAAVTRAEVARAHLVADLRGRGLQRGVADGVTVGVVQALEMIEVDHQQRQGLTRARGLGHRSLERFVEGPAVEQAGETIVQSQSHVRLQQLDQIDGGRGLVRDQGQHPVDMRAERAALAHGHERALQAIAEAQGMHEQSLAGKSAPGPEERQAAVARRVDGQTLCRRVEVPGHPGAIGGGGAGAHPLRELLRHPGQAFDDGRVPADDARVDGARSHLLDRAGHERVDVLHLDDLGQTLGGVGRGLELHLAFGMGLGFPLVLHHLRDQVREPLQHGLRGGEGLAFLVIHHQHAADHAPHPHRHRQQCADAHRRLVVGQRPEQGPVFGGVEGPTAIHDEAHRIVV